MRAGPALFTAAHLAGRGNFSGPLINVADVDGGHFNEKRIGSLVE
jgi:hypothetical protein